MSKQQMVVIGFLNKDKYTSYFLLKTLRNISNE